MQTPLRRSRRGQPIVASQSTHKPQEGTQTIVGEVMHTRALKMEDLAQDQLEMLQRREVSIEDLQTRFHGEFSRSGSVRRAARTYGRTSRVAQTQEEKDIYRVGDTVLVDTGARESSIAVLTAIWTIVMDDQALHTNVAMHWFLQPKELPRFRATHAHEEVCLLSPLCSLMLTSYRMRFITRLPRMLFSPFGTSPVAALSLRIPVTYPPLTASYQSDIHATTLTQVSTTGPSFYCFHAINSLKGIYYEFNWEDYRSEAMTSANFWEALGQWDVTAMNTPETPQKVAGIAEPQVKRHGHVLEDVPEEEESAGSNCGGTHQDDFSPSQT